MLNIIDHHLRFDRCAHGGRAGDSGVKPGKRGQNADGLPAPGRPATIPWGGVRGRGDETSSADDRRGNSG